MVIILENVLVHDNLNITRFKRQCLSKDGSIRLLHIKHKTI